MSEKRELAVAVKEWLQNEEMENYPVKKGQKVKVVALQLSIPGDPSRAEAEVRIFVDGFRKFFRKISPLGEIGKAELLSQVFSLSLELDPENLKWQPVLDEFCRSFSEFRNNKNKII